MRVLMRPIGRRAPPCSLRELPPSGEKTLFDTKMASRGSEYSEPLSYVVLTLKNAYAGHEKEKGPLRCAFGAFSERDCFEGVRPRPRLDRSSGGGSPQPPIPVDEGRSLVDAWLGLG